MAWIPERRATDEDVRVLNARAETFAARHGIEIGGPYALDPVSEVEGALTLERNAHLRPLWQRIVRRALDSQTATGIAYGNVGRGE